MINGFNAPVWNPAPPLLGPMFAAPMAVPMPMDAWCPMPAPPEFLYGNAFPQAPPAWAAPAPMMFPGQGLPFFPPPWAMQMPVFPSFTFPIQAPTLTGGQPVAAAPIDFQALGSTPKSGPTSMSMDQKKALLAEREAAFKDSQKNWSKSWSSWGTSIMNGIEERRKAEKERAQ